MMADSGEQRFLGRVPQPFAVDFIRWLPIAGADRLIAAAVHDSDSNSSPSIVLQLLTPNPDPNSCLHLLTSSPLAARASALRASPSSRSPLLAASTVAGSLELLAVDHADGSLLPVADIGPGPEFHSGTVRGLDVSGEGGLECLTAGEDGRIHLVVVGEDGSLAVWKVADSGGLASYVAARFASAAEFAVGGAGIGVQWWDRRRPGGFVSQCKGVWGRRGVLSGMVHSIDIHPSRKHVAVVGGSFGTIFAWDLRSPQQPIMLAGAGTQQAVSASEVWEVHYDSGLHSLALTSARTLPVMMCSEDGMLAVVQQDEAPIRLLTEPFSINSFDIDPENPSNVVCTLEAESIAVLMRGNRPMLFD